MIKSSMCSINVAKQIVRWYVIKRSIGDFDRKNSEFTMVNVNEFGLTRFVSNDRPVKEFKKYNFNKIEFIQNHFYILPKVDDFRRFGRCFKIYIDNGNLKVLMYVYRSIRFHRSICCYEIEATNELILAELDESNLYYINLLPIHFDGKIYIQKTFL